MKPQLHKLPLISDTSFLYNNWQCDYFDKPWHFHEEYELVVIDKSNGTKFIGDKVSAFEEGELLLIGPRIPHFFKNNDEYYKKSGKLEASSIFIHFTLGFLGGNFFDLPEMRFVKKLLDDAKNVVEIKGRVKAYIISRLRQMQSESPSLRLVSLLDILVRLSESDETILLMPSGYEGKKEQEISKGKDKSRITIIFEYIVNNFKKTIYVNEIADELHMSNASFSRYFKHHTRQNFSDYVTQVRISHACKLLMEDKLTISNICFESGFDNLSNFYKHFKKITAMVPKDYRSRFIKGSENRLV